MCHAEALLFVDDHESEVIEMHIARNEPMSADNEVDRTIGDAGDRVADFGGCAETVEQVDAHRVVRHAFAKGAPMLFGKYGGWHEDGRLFAAGDGFERGTDRNLGFAKADITADQAIHRACSFQVAFGFVDRATLIACFDMMERAFEFPHPSSVGRVGVSRFVVALGLDAQKFGGVIENGFFGRLAGGFPCGAAKFVELWRATAEADIFADQVRLLEWDSEHRAIAVLKEHFLAVVVLNDAAKSGDAVFIVHDQIAMAHFINRSG